VCVCAREDVRRCIGAQLRIEFAAAVEHPAGNPKMLGCQGFVSTGMPQNFVDDAILEVGQGFAEVKGQVNLRGADGIGRRGRRMGSIYERL
jgi:hypothetical protein